MQFIIMDLEWNNAYCKKLKGYINEIIEFGACKVDKDFNVIDEFSVIVKAQVGKKLQGRVKALTHITNEDIYLTEFRFLKPFQCSEIGSATMKMCSFLGETETSEL